MIAILCVALLLGFLFLGSYLANIVTQRKKNRLMERFILEQEAREAYDDPAYQHYMDIQEAIWQQAEDTSRAHRALQDMLDAANRNRFGK